jgi:hypothetical protein
MKDRRNDGFQVNSTAARLAAMPRKGQRDGEPSTTPPSMRLETHVDLGTSLVRGSQINIQNSHSGRGDPGNAARLPKRCRPHAFQLFADLA